MLHDFLSDESGMGVVEVILIIVVLIGLVIIAVMYVIWGGYQSKKYQRESAVFDNAVTVENADVLTNMGKTYE